MTTLKQYLDFVLDKTSIIQENRDGRFIQYHTSFCLGEDDKSHLFLMMGHGDDNTMVDINTEVSIDGNSIHTKTIYGENITLYFFGFSPIPTPFTKL